MGTPWKSNIFLFRLPIDILFSYFCIFSAGLFSCLDEVDQTCLIGWLLPCYLFGQNAEQVDGSDKITACVKFAALSYCYLSCLIHKPQRETIRAVYGLEENPSDFLATCCCASCANCQEARELKLRG
jgi:Cys-rich protein (TIGR01571 family)